jgi:SAM-dependent methyltransferase
MTKIAGIADQRYLSKQYRDASNLNARADLHRRFSTNPLGLCRWIFDQFHLPPTCRILELGCGPGGLWLENIDRIPEGWEIHPTDASAGMVRQAQGALAPKRRGFRFGIADAQAVPFAAGTFNAVIANHMLYHVPDRAKALSEIRRALGPGGRVYASTFGTNHMRELADLAAGFDPAWAVWGSGGLASQTFTLENGAAQLAQAFTDVRLHRYEDALVVTESEPLVRYLLSGRLTLDGERRAGLAEFMARELERGGGSIRITKETGLFEAVRI